jgi:hypothetical protein
MPIYVSSGPDPIKHEAARFISENIQIDEKSGALTIAVSRANAGNVVNCLNTLGIKIDFLDLAGGDMAMQPNPNWKWTDPHHFTTEFLSHNRFMERLQDPEEMHRIRLHFNRAGATILRNNGVTNPVLEERYKQWDSERGRTA